MDLNWNKIVHFVNHGTPEPSHKVVKTEEEWKQLLSEHEFAITRMHGTERAGTGEYCESFEPGVYECRCCGHLLFDSNFKFESGTGWPSFAQPVTNNAVKYSGDHSYGMFRVEALCNVCDAHLGHVFPDGPEPSGLRYCMNSASLKKVIYMEETSIAIFGGGCFWCTEAIFDQLKGVVKVESGYSGGHIEHPTYAQVCDGITGHAEVIKIEYDPLVISLHDLIEIHLYTHDPTTLNRQGADWGTQYRSVIFYRSEEEKQLIQTVIEKAQPDFKDKIVTKIEALSSYYPAENYHQNYFRFNSENPYCQAVIPPKLKKLREKYAHALK